jgi:hypothetical protein
MKTKLVSKSNQVKDYDVITGVFSKNLIHRAVVPRTIKVGEVFNVYLSNGRKEGCIWVGNLLLSLQAKVYYSA